MNRSLSRYELLLEVANLKKSKHYGKYTPSEREDYVKRFHDSGMSRREFALRNNIPHTNLENWIKKGCVDKRKPRSAMFPEIDNELYQWMLDEQAKGCNLDALTYRDLQTKAMEIADKHGITNFNASSGWIGAFKRRKKLREKPTADAPQKRLSKKTVSDNAPEKPEKHSSNRKGKLVKRKKKSKLMERKMATPGSSLVPEPWLYATPADWPQVVLFGDSHFQNGFASNGIASLIAAKLQRRCDVVTRGFNGYNTKLARCAFDRFLPRLAAENIAAFVIMFGSNDACQKGDRGHVNLQEYSENLTYFASRLKNHGVAANRIILISPPPSNQEAWTKECQTVGRTVSTRDNGVIQRYALLAGIVAQQQGTQFVDLFTAMFNSPDWTSLFTDGLHLNAEGAQKMYSVLGQSLDIILQSCTMRFPDWKDVDPDNPEADFVPVS